MSINLALFTLVNERQMPHMAKSLLLSISVRADENNRCSPSVRLLAAETGMSVPSAHRALRLLLAQGLVESTAQIDAFGGRAANLYHVKIEAIQALPLVTL